MKNSKRAFDKINTRFQTRKESFKQVFERWMQRGWVDDAKKGLTLVESAEGQIRELQELLAQTAEGRVAQNVIVTKLKTFKETYKNLHEMTKSSIRQWVEAIVVALVLAVVLRNFLFGLYHVPTGSAEYNILVGDRIWGNKLVYFFTKPQRGELVIFDNPEFPYDKSNMIKDLWQRYVGFGIPLLGLEAGPDNWVKRVIAIPGDTIEGRVEDGKTVVYLNGKKLDEPYVNQYPLIHVRKASGFIPLDSFGPLSIPEFLRYKIKEYSYTYDPSKSYENQSYYKLTEDEVIINPLTGKPFLSHAYSPSFDYNTMRCIDQFGPLKVPEGMYWMMGDSRKNSKDSRYWWFLDEKLIHGRASFIIYSVDSEEAFWLFDLIKHPIDFWTKHIRLSRFFNGLNTYNNWGSREQK